jgi:predicted nucleic acid-binding Zn finger protein
LVLLKLKENHGVMHKPTASSNTSLIVKTVSGYCTCPFWIKKQKIKRGRGFYEHGLMVNARLTRWREKTVSVVRVNM